MRTLAFAAAGVLLLASSGTAGIFDDECRHTAPRKVGAQAAGVGRVIIHAEAGSLTVTGSAGASQIVASGTACTSDDDLLPKMTLSMSRSGADLHVRAEIPRKTVFFGFYEARLDFGVSLPAGMPVVIDDDSGWMKVSGTGKTTIDDDSGAIEVRNVRGDLTIDDDSGSIDVEDVVGRVTINDESGGMNLSDIRGDVTIEDDSGAISIQRVEGTVRIPDDDSGEIRVRNVRGDVLIDEDDSGSVDVADIGGRFTVGRKSSGSIDYARVAGKVSVPRED